MEVGVKGGMLKKEGGGWPVPLFRPRAFASPLPFFGSRLFAPRPSSHDILGAAFRIQGPSSSESNRERLKRERGVSMDTISCRDRIR